MNSISTNAALKVKRSPKQNASEFHDLSVHLDPEGEER